jgi:GMP synthase (glutamine-hydrolysing)
MAILILQHSDIGGAGRLGACLRDHGFALDTRRPDLHPVGSCKGLPPDLDDAHGLVILGGPQNVTDIAKHPWMQAEAGLIQAAHARHLPVIGICLGAQLIAHALGGQVGPRDKPAVGFHDLLINTTGQTETILSGVAWTSPQLFACGQEIRQLPAGATLLASTKHTKVAVFKAGVRTFGFIPHIECDRPQAEALLAASKGDLPAAGITAGELTAQLDQSYPAFARLSDRLCVNLATYCFPLRRRLSA